MALINSLTSGVSALRTFSKGLETIGDNIANVNTTGFKSSKATNKDGFADILQTSASSSASNSNTDAMQVGSGVSLASIRQKFTQGALTTTGNSSDLGISGNGFFVVKSQTTGKEYYTRSGDFRVDDNYKLVTSEGDSVLDSSGAAIQLTGTTTSGTSGTASLTSYAIDSQGKISQFYSDGSSSTGQTVGVTNFRDPNALMREGGNKFSNPSAAGQVGGAIGAPGTNGTGKIVQGALEGSNVDLTQEFSDLIVAQRSFQAGSRIISVSDSVLEEVVNLKR